MTGDQLYVRHILDAIEKIESYVSVGRDLFLAASHWQDAVIRRLEIIGEATKRLSPEVRSRHATVPWRRIAGLRDVLIHGYMHVDVQALWEVTQKDMPALKTEVLAILRELSCTDAP